MSGRLHIKANRLVPYKWYGFDLDGTIADNTNHACGYGNIGKPIKRMTNLMKCLHKRGCWVKIVTARLGDVGSSPEAQAELKEHIWEWCDEHIGFRPEITDRKDASMECLFDDRARQVIRNKGIDMGYLARELAETLDDVWNHPRRCRERLKRMRRKCISLGLIAEDRAD